MSRIDVNSIELVKEISHIIDCSRRHIIFLYTKEKVTTLSQKLLILNFNYLQRHIFKKKKSKMAHSDIFYSKPGSKYALDFGRIEYKSTSDVDFLEKVPAGSDDFGTSSGAHNPLVDRLIEEEEDTFSPSASPRFSRRRDRRHFKKYKESTSRNRPLRGLGGGSWSPDVSYGHDSDACEDDKLVPSAPPMELMDTFHGYEEVSFEAVSVPPPPCLLEEDTDRTETRGPLPIGPQITEHQARAALLAHVADRCCWGTGAAKKMAIAKINYDSAFHYELQTFTEKRETSWAFTPYGGGDVDGPICGPAPLPWEVEADSSHIFHDEVKVIQVPHTASIKECHRCKGSGSLQCSECHGKGWTRCLSCHGDGWTRDTSGYKERCFYCQSSTHGHGRQDCLKCNAKGRVACPPCDSYGQIRCFIRLTITWKVHTSEHIVRKGGLPEELVKEVSGQVAFEEEGSRLLPLSQFPDSTINLASAQIVNNHRNSFPDEKIIKQRHQVRIVPVAEVEYVFKGGPAKFWVYGYENKAHSPDYPHTCCWGCCCIM